MVHDKAILTMEDTAAIFCDSVTVILTFIIIIEFCHFHTLCLKETSLDFTGRSISHKRFKIDIVTMEY